MIYGVELNESKITGGMVYSYHSTVEKEQTDFYVSFERIIGGDVISVLELSENYSIVCVPSQQHVNYIAFPVQDKPNENKVRCHYFTRNSSKNNNDYGLNLYDEAGELTFGVNALNLNVLEQLKFSQPFERELDIADDEVLGIIDLSGSPREDIVIATGLIYEPPETVLGYLDIDLSAVSIHRKGNRLIGVYNRKRDRNTPIQDISHIISQSNQSGRVSFTGFENYTAYGLLCKFRRPTEFVLSTQYS